jgi:hypothetical protein
VTRPPPLPWIFFRSDFLAFLKVRISLDKWFTKTIFTSNQRAAPANRRSRYIWPSRPKWPATALPLSPIPVGKVLKAIGSINVSADGCRGFGRSLQTGSDR